MRELPILGDKTYELMQQLLTWDDVRTESNVTEELSALIIGEMHAQNLTSSNSSFLMEHCPELIGRIGDEKLRARPISLAF